LKETLKDKIVNEQYWNLYAIIFFLHNPEFRFATLQVVYIGKIEVFYMQPVRLPKSPMNSCTLSIPAMLSFWLGSTEYSAKDLSKDFKHL
jgi:hypothetical protein